jgi:hypothetical protein
MNGHGKGKECVKNLKHEPNIKIKMIGKSIDGSWQIGVGAAGDLVANLVGNYYGL